MNEAQRIVEALEKLVEEDYIEGGWDDWDKGFSAGLRKALSEAQSIAEGFK